MHKEGNLLFDIESIENMLVQERVTEKRPEKSETKKLMDTCLIMRDDKVATLGECTAMNAYMISIISVIVSAAALVVSAAS